MSTPSNQHESGEQQPAQPKAQLLPKPWTQIPKTEPTGGRIECSICDQDVTVGYLSAPCHNIAHTFCVGCLSDWWDSNRIDLETCPMCRINWEWNYSGGRTTGARNGTRDPTHPAFDFPNTFFGYMSTVRQPAFGEEAQPASEVLTAQCSFDPFEGLVKLSKVPVQPRKQNGEVNRLPTVHITLGQFLAALAAKTEEPWYAVESWMKTNPDAELWTGAQARRLILDSLIHAVNQSTNIQLKNDPILRRNLEHHFEDYFKHYFAGKLWTSREPIPTEEDDDENAPDGGMVMDEDEDEFEEDEPSDMWDEELDGPHPGLPQQRNDDGPYRPLLPSYRSKVPFAVAPFTIAVCIYEFLLLTLFQTGLDVHRDAESAGWDINVDRWLEARGSIQANLDQPARRMTMDCMREVMQQIHGGIWYRQWLGDRQGFRTSPVIVSITTEPRAHFR